jgi:hypothetical protein
MFLKSQPPTGYGKNKPEPKPCSSFPDSFNHDADRIVRCLLHSIGKENWRVTCAGVAFAGLLMLWIIFYRHLKKKEVQKSKTGK